MLVLKNLEVFSPQPKGCTDLWLSGEQIVELSTKREPTTDDTVVDCSGLIAVPGLIDMHVHITGGGGEKGMATRTPELMLSTMIKNGVTSVAGLLGTDTVTRSLDNLLAKARGLNEEGVTTVIYTGGYDFPSPSFCGSIRRDLFLIPEVRGVKIAYADHRCSYPTVAELERLLADVRVGGMLRNQLSQLHVHLGDDADDIPLLIDLAKRRPHLASHLTLTHVNRSKPIFEMALKAAAAGINIDLSSGLTPETLYADTLTIVEAVQHYQAANLPLSQLTVTSDGNGSAASYNEDGSISSIVASDLGTLMRSFVDILDKEILTMEEALSLYTTQPARRLGLQHKGSLLPHQDADILLLTSDFQLHSLYARGRLMFDRGQLIHAGFFE